MFPQNLSVSACLLSPLESHFYSRHDMVHEVNEVNKSGDVNPCARILYVHLGATFGDHHVLAVSRESSRRVELKHYPRPIGTTYLTSYS